MLYTTAAHSFTCMCSEYSQLLNHWYALENHWYAAVGLCLHTHVEGNATDNLRLLSRIIGVMQLLTVCTLMWGVTLLTT